MPDDFDELVAEARELGHATVHATVAGTPAVYGSRAFFAAATEVLLESTRERRELGGACYFVVRDAALVLVGLQTRSSGQAVHVALAPSWGSVLWHTHPGMSFSVAAFSDEDLAGARRAGRPLLVIGYQSASPDVLGLTLAAGLAGGKDHEVTRQLLRVGVAARVCWPTGEVRPVRRYRQEGVGRALDEASFHVDRVLGAAARAVQPVSRAIGSKVLDVLHRRIGSRSK